MASSSQNRQSIQWIVILLDLVKIMALLIGAAMPVLALTLRQVNLTELFWLTAFCAGVSYTAIRLKRSLIKKLGYMTLRPSSEVDPARLYSSQSQSSDFKGAQAVAIGTVLILAAIMLYSKLRH